MSDRRDRQLLVAELLRRAEDDVLNLEFHVNQRGGTPALACFLAEQVAEKYLKALLLSRQGDYPRTHDLNQLLTLLKPFVPEIIIKLGDAVVLLSPYYVGTRYPADIPLESFSWQEAEGALAAAMLVKSFVINLLNQ